MSPAGKLMMKGTKMKGRTIIIIRGFYRPYPTSPAGDQLGADVEDEQHISSAPVAFAVRSLMKKKDASAPQWPAGSRYRSAARGAGHRRA